METSKIKQFTMDKAVDRLERMFIIGRYIQLYDGIMPEDEKMMHIGRLMEELRNAKQIADYWKTFADQNGVRLEE